MPCPAPTTTAIAGGKDHAWADLPDRHWSRTTPAWWVTLFMHRPGRREDSTLIHRIASGQVDPDEAVFMRTGGRKPHQYYW